MRMYKRIAGSQFGSSLLFGAALFAACMPSGGLAEAAGAGAAAAASWFASVPAIRRLAGGGRNA
jgi:hypothetical protein